VSDRHPPPSALSLGTVIAKNFDARGGCLNIPNNSSTPKDTISWKVRLGECGKDVGGQRLDAQLRMLQQSDSLDFLGNLVLQVSAVLMCSCGSLDPCQINWVGVHCISKQYHFHIMPPHVPLSLANHPCTLSALSNASRLPRGQSHTKDIPSQWLTTFYSSVFALMVGVGEVGTRIGIDQQGLTLPGPRPGGMRFA
jgi:hypothetical protein